MRLMEKTCLLLLLLFVVQPTQAEHRNYVPATAQAPRAAAESGLRHKAPQKDQAGADLAGLWIGALFAMPFLSSIFIILYGISTISTFGIIALVTAGITLLSLGGLIFAGLQEQAAGGKLSGLLLSLALLGLWVSLLLMGLAWGFTGVAIVWPLLTIIGFSAVTVGVVGLLIQLLSI